MITDKEYQKPKRTLARQWYKHIEKSIEKNQSPEEYCQRNNLSIKRFLVMMRKQCKSAKQDFVPVVFQKPEPQPINSCEVYSPARYGTLELGNNKRFILESKEALAQVTLILKEALL